MSILNILFKKKNKCPIKIDIKSFQCAFEENINLGGLRSQGTFLVSIQKNNDESRNLVLGTNETLLSRSKEKNLLASLRMLDVSDLENYKPAIVKVFQDGSISALSEQSDGSLQKVALQCIDFEPQNTTYLNENGSIKEYDPSPREQDYMRRQQKKLDHDTNEWLDSDSPAIPHKSTPMPDAFLNLVLQISDRAEGAFANVVGDLLSFEHSDQMTDPVTFVAFACAYRYAIAGLYFQGVETADRYNSAKAAHEGAASYIGATTEQAIEGNEQGFYLVFRYAKVSTTIITEIDSYAEKVINFYTLASKHNIEVRYVEGGYMSIENCEHLIQRDLH